MTGLCRALERAGHPVSIWDDASVFGDLDESIGRLRSRLGEYEHGLGVVTHSFGDWLFRQSVAEDACAVATLVSLVPVMTSSLAARLVRPLGAFLPEITVMASDQRAGDAMQTPAGIDRLVVWSRFDPWVRRVDTRGFRSTRSIVVAGSHNTVLWQPSVHALVAAHLVRERAGGD